MLWLDLMPETPCAILSNCRRVGDQSSLIIPLDCGGVQKPSTSDHVIEYIQFKIFPESVQLGSQIRGFPQIGFHKLESSVLRHTCLYAASAWNDFLMDRLRRWLQIEVAKLKPEDRIATGIRPFFNISLPIDLNFTGSWN